MARPDRQETPDLGPLPGARDPRAPPHRARRRQPFGDGRDVVGILQGLGVAKKVLSAESEGMSAKDVKRRIQEASKEVAVGAAIKRAIDGLNAAIIAVVIVPTVITGGSS